MNDQNTYGEIALKAYRDCVKQRGPCEIYSHFNDAANVVIEEFKRRENLKKEPNNQPGGGVPDGNAVGLASRSDNANDLAAEGPTPNAATDWQESITAATIDPLIGKAVEIEWRRDCDSDWPTFLLLYRWHDMVLLKGMDHPDGSKHDGSTVSVPMSDIHAIRLRPTVKESLTVDAATHYSMQKCPGCGLTLVRAPDLDGWWCDKCEKYPSQFTTKESDPRSKQWCAYCGKMGDHTSGGCKDLAENYRVAQAERIVVSMRQRIEELEREVNALKIMHKVEYSENFNLGEELSTLKAQLTELQEVHSHCNPLPPESPWIRCSDRMPSKEDGEKVICAYASGQYGWEYAHIINSSHSTISHWMPIPPFPKEPEEDGFEKWCRGRVLVTNSMKEFARMAWNDALASNAAGELQPPPNNPK